MGSPFVFLLLLCRKRKRKQYENKCGQKEFCHSLRRLVPSSLGRLTIAVEVKTSARCYVSLNMHLQARRNLPGAAGKRQTSLMVILMKLAGTVRIHVSKGGSNGGERDKSKTTMIRGDVI